MDSKRLADFLLKLDLPKGHYAVFGGACLAIRNLRCCDDLDIFISKDLYKRLATKGWTETSVKERKPYLINRLGLINIQAFSTWEGEGWQPDIQSYLSYPEEVAGFAFMPLRKLHDWKNATRRPKDIEDIKLIENYWQLKA